MNLYTDLKNAIAAEYPELSDSDFDFQPSPENQPGDFGLACFRLAKALRKSPPEAANTLVHVKYPPVITGVMNTGPYLNFTLDRTRFSTELIAEILEKKDLYGSGSSGVGRKVVLEHTSINPNASPHIGRSRNGMIGDVLARLLRFEGYDVNVHYYVNDIGKQIGLLVLHAEGKENLEFHEVLDVYVEANRRAETDQEFERQGLEMLNRFEKGEPDVVRAFERVVGVCLKGQLQVLARLGLAYDTFDRESQFLYDPRMDEVMNRLENKGALFIDEYGRKVVDLKPLGYLKEEGRYVVLARANGSSMYMYRDIAYTLEKISRDGDMNIIVLGEDHKMYYEQMETIIRSLGLEPPEAVHYSYIVLKDGKMSTRQGNVVLLEDFLDEAIRLAGERVDQQWGELPEEERAEIARVIGIGAVKFSILSVRPSRNVVFDWDAALSFTGDTGPYIQYSCTRIASILRKLDSKPDVPAGTMIVTHDAEWDLMFRLALVGGDIAMALKTRNPAIIANSALEISRKFSIFYNECPVLSAPDERVRDSRIALCIATRQVLHNLLGLLGIEAPERM
jgi:arginyl-tRNA synthetase